MGDVVVVWHWGNGGYYPLTQDGGLPAGKQHWEAFARYAPIGLVRAAIFGALEQRRG